MEELKIFIPKKKFSQTISLQFPLQSRWITGKFKTPFHSRPIKKHTQFILNFPSIFNWKTISAHGKTQSQTQILFSKETLHPLVKFGSPETANSFEKEEKSQVCRTDLSTSLFFTAGR